MAHPSGRTSQTIRLSEVKFYLLSLRPYEQPADEMIRKRVAQHLRLRYQNVRNANGERIRPMIVVRTVMERAIDQKVIFWKVIETKEFSGSLIRKLTDEIATVKQIEDPLRNGHLRWTFEE